MLRSLAPLALLLPLQQPPAPPVPAPLPPDPCDSLVIAQTHTALATLRAAAAVHSAPDHPTVSLTYEGAVSIEGHAMRPGMVRTIPVRIDVVADPAACEIALRESTGEPGTLRTELTLVRDGRVAFQPRPDISFGEYPADKARQVAADAALWLPASAVHAALAAAPSCRPGPPLKSGDHTLDPVSFTDATGRTCTLLLDSSHRVTRIERLASHPRLGDTCDWTQFDDWQTEDGAAVPRHISRFIVEASATIRYDLTLKSSDPPPTAPFDLPADHHDDIADWYAPPPSQTIECVALTPGLWSADLAASNSRVLIIENESSLMLLGAPDGDDVCSALLTSLKARFPGKPVATVAFSHHHPSPSGGLRVFAAAGAAILCPTGLEPYARSLLSRPVSLGPPAIPAPDHPRLELFDNETTVGSGALRVQLLDIAEQSAHTFHYVVFYFPGPGILFEDDLGYFPQSSAAKINPRLKGLVAALEAHDIHPKRLIQAWPVQKVVREVDWSTVAELVQSDQGAGHK